MVLIGEMMACYENEICSERRMLMQSFLWIDDDCVKNTFRSNSREARYERKRTISPQFSAGQSKELIEWESLPTCRVGRWLTIVKEIEFHSVFHLAVRNCWFQFSDGTERWREGWGTSSRIKRERERNLFRVTWFQLEFKRMKRLNWPKKANHSFSPSVI